MIEDFNKAIELNPQYAEAYVWRGSAKLEIGEEKEGCLDLIKAVDLGMDKAKSIFTKFCE